MTSVVEERLRQHGIHLPAAPAAVAAYVPVLQTGQLVVTSGQLPMVGKELMFAGKVGSEVTEEQARNAARQCALNALAQIKSLVGNLDRVKRIIKLDGFVQSAPGFSQQPMVMNGASELMILAFGEAGRHTRCAVGVNELPLNAAVEVAVWTEVAEE